MENSEINEPPTEPTEAAHVPMELSPMHETMCWLSASGMTKTDIAKKMNVARNTVYKYLRKPEFIYLVKKFQFQVYGKDPKKHFDRMVPKAMNTIETLMEDDQVKDSTRLSCAKEVLDRSMGKPNQKLEVEHSIVKKIYDKLDQEDSSKKSAIEVESKCISEREETEIIDDATFVESEPEIEQTDTAVDEVDPDEWIKNNL